MAERSNASSKKSQEAAQDVTTLQKRGRRRLVGAIALVLLAVIVLPMVFDPEPRPNAPLVNVRIPSEDGSKFTPKAATKSAEPEPAPAAAPVPEPSQPAPSAEPPKAAEAPAPKPVPKPFEKIVTKSVDKPAEKPAEKAAESKPVEKPAEKPVAKAPEKAAAPVAAPAAPAGEKFMVQVGAFASPEKVKEITAQLKEAKLLHYTETVATAKGEVTRVRLGPFNSKEAAEKARDRAKALGLSPANPVAK